MCDYLEKMFSLEYFSTIDSSKGDEFIYCMILLCVTEISFFIAFNRNLIAL